MARGSVSNGKSRAILLDSGSSQHCIRIRVQGNIFVQHALRANVGDVWVVCWIDCDGHFPGSVSGHGTALEFMYS